MVKVQFKDESELVQLLRESKAYREFTNKYLQPKIEREKQAWLELVEHRNEYTKGDVIKFL